MCLGVTIAMRLRPRDREQQFRNNTGIGHAQYPQYVYQSRMC